MSGDVMARVRGPLLLTGLVLLALIVSIVGRVWPTACSEPTDPWDQAIFYIGAGLFVPLFWTLRRLRTGPGVAPGIATGARIGTVVLLLGLLSWLGARLVPGVVAYLSKSRTAESTQNVGSIYRGAVSYFEAEQVDANGKVLEPRFPPSVGPTPPLSEVGTQKVGPHPEAWDHSSWQALTFAMGDPHYFAYQFVSRGIGTSAEFTARAYGNLDGDDVYSTFERQGSVDASGSVRGSSGIYVHCELD